MNLRETIENQMAAEVAEAKSDIKDDSYEIPNDKPNTSMDVAVDDALFDHCDCARNIPYMDWSHDPACSLFVPLNKL